MNSSKDHQTRVQATAAFFWKTIPPIWHYMRSIIHRIAREDFGITSTQFQVLHRIKEENKRTVSDLSDCMFLSRPSISRAVEDLAKAGLLEREGDSVDRRIIYLHVSSKGEEVISQIHAKNSLYMQDLFLGLDDDELERLNTAFRVIEKVLQKNSIEK